MQNFLFGDVEKTLPEFIKERNITPDVVFLDPPRKGCDKTALDTLIQIKPKRIVYVSCNPATLARDLSLLDEYYNLEHISICDMFPRNKPRGMYFSTAIKIRDGILIYDI